MLHRDDERVKKGEHLLHIWHMYSQICVYLNQRDSGPWHVLYAVSVHFSHSESPQQFSDICTTIYAMCMNTLTMK